VIDNLETVHDVESLLPLLQDFANPTRFILTSRYNLYSEPNIYHFAVSELSREDTRTLVRHKAELSNLPVLATAADAELACIYDTVGGNPLAIRLVVGQVHVHSLHHIVRNLRQVKGESTENLYAYIYRQAWESLDELGKRILLAMPLAPPAGDDLEFIAAMSEIDIDELARGLNQLVARNLVDARGGLNQRRYSIHGLTRTFLHQQVLGWMQ
ncbi:MAG: hypothetical protein KDE47_25410, partial [Caldilineaceae bacterium]|nr:hypothetical protein [Caldilineaceae bacterium]